MVVGTAYAGVQSIDGTVLPDTHIGVAIMVRDPAGQLIEISPMIRWRPLFTTQSPPPLASSTCCWRLAVLDRTVIEKIHPHLK